MSEEPTDAVVVAVEKTEHRLFQETMSAEIGALAFSLSAAQGAMSNGVKNKQGYGYKYLELSSIIDIARSALSENELAIIQTHELVRGSGASVVTHTTILHSSGQWHKSSLEIPIKEMPQLSAAQMVGVCCTYGRRYAMQAACLIASEEDTDGTSL